MDAKQPADVPSQRVTRETLEASNQKFSKIRNRRSLLTWLKEQGDMAEQRSGRVDENVSDEGDDMDCLADLDSGVDSFEISLSDTETTVSAFSEADERAFKELEKCKEVIERAHKFNKYFTKFINRWNGIS